MDFVVVAAIVAGYLALGAFLVDARLALARDRQPDDPDYRPRHARRRSELDRAVNASWREVTGHPTPWSQRPPRRT